MKGGIPAITNTGDLYIVVFHSDVFTGLSAIDTVDGHLVRAMPGVDFGDAALAPDGTIYDATGPSVQAYSGQGAPLWEARLAGVPAHPSTSMPLVLPDGTIYVGSDSELVAVDSSGHVRWQLEKPDGAMVLAAGANGTILAAGCDALDAVSPDGKVLWSDHIGPPGSVIGARPSLVTDREGTAFVGTADGKVRIFSPDGNLLRTLSVGPRQHFSASVMIAAGRLIVQGTDDTLRVYGK